jgi:hypothetical protein
MANEYGNNQSFNDCLLEAVDKHIEQIKCHLLRLEPQTEQQLAWINSTITNIKGFQDGQLSGLRRVFQ